MTSVQQATRPWSSRLSFKVEKRKPFKTRTSQTTVTRENGIEEMGTMRTSFILFTLLQIDWFIALQCSQQETPKGDANLFFCISIDFWILEEARTSMVIDFWQMLQFFIFFYHSFFGLSYKAQIIYFPMSNKCKCNGCYSCCSTSQATISSSYENQTWSWKAPPPNPRSRECWLLRKHLIQFDVFRILLLYVWLRCHAIKIKIVPL